MFMPFPSCPLHRRLELAPPARCSPCLGTGMREAKPRELGQVQVQVRDMFNDSSV